jgi:hypothetical protein
MIGLEAFLGDVAIAVILAQAVAVAAAVCRGGKGR